MSQQKKSFQTAGFRALLVAQSLSAFNDNAFKTVVALLMVMVLPAGKSAQFIALAGTVFIVPFLLLSTAAYQWLYGKPMEGAHNALADCRMTGWMAMTCNELGLWNFEPLTHQR